MFGASGFVQDIACSTHCLEGDLVETVLANLQRW